MMNKLTQEFIRPYVEEWVKLKCPHYGKMLLDTVVNSTIGSDDGMSFALRNYIFGYVNADINKLKMDNIALQQELDELKELTRWHNGDFENPTKEGEYNVFVSCANGDDPFYSVDKWSDNRGWSNFGWHKSDSDPDFELPQFFVAAWSSFHEIDIDLEQGE